jgi:hypothetical protein
MNIAANICDIKEQTLWQNKSTIMPLSGIKPLKNYLICGLLNDTVVDRLMSSELGRT